MEEKNISKEIEKDINEQEIEKQKNREELKKTNEKNNKKRNAIIGGSLVAILALGLGLGLGLSNKDSDSPEWKVPIENPELLTPEIDQGISNGPLNTNYEVIKDFIYRNKQDSIKETLQVFYWTIRNNNGVPTPPTDPSEPPRFPIINDLINTYPGGHPIFINKIIEKINDYNLLSPLLNSVVDFDIVTTSKKSFDIYYDINYFDNFTAGNAKLYSSTPANGENGYYNSNFQTFDNTIDSSGVWHVTNLNLNTEYTFEYHYLLKYDNSGTEINHEVTNSFNYKTGSIQN